MYVWCAVQKSFVEGSLNGCLVHNCVHYGCKSLHLKYQGLTITQTLVLVVLSGLYACIQC